MSELSPDNAPTTPNSPQENADAAAAPANQQGVKGVKRLTKEEQMALYEKALKEDDWGHQPC